MLTGHLQIRWGSTFEVSFLSDETFSTLGVANFLESEETICFLTRPEFGLSPQEAAQALRDAATGTPVTIPRCIQLSEGLLCEIFAIRETHPSSRLARPA